MYYQDDCQRVKLPIKPFTHHLCYDIVKGFQQFKDHSDDVTSGSIGGSQQVHTQPSETDGSVHLDIDEDEEIADVSPGPSVRPLGKKAAKEANRKGKKSAHDQERMTLAVETMAANQALLVAQREKREEEFRQQVWFEQQREIRKEQMKL